MKFPKGFLFGSATSAHQTEGGNTNSDWYKWEQTPGNIQDGSTSLVAADSWNKWREDIKLLKETGQNAYRFSVEWARIEPKEGKFDQKAIDHYKEILTELKKNNITSMVTLHHFTNPLWLAGIGGFTNSKSARYFTRYALKIAEELGEPIDLLATFNEPKVYILKGYIQKEWYPAEKNYFQAFLAWKNITKAHNLAYKEIKKMSNLPVGIVQNISAYEANKPSIINNLLVLFAKFIDNDIFMIPLKNNFDFLGINYYMKFKIQLTKPHVSWASTLKNDYGWSISQEGLYQVIMENIHWKKPIYITENGVADEKDTIRPEFINQALENLLKAIKNNADIRGYFYWSLLDNFEWASGYSMKFGLATIDRKLRHSAKVYKELIDKYS